MMVRYAFAGDRAVSVRILEFLREAGAAPEALLVSGPERATHADDLRRVAGVHQEKVLVGDAFRQDAGRELLAGLRLDYLVSVHFPYLVPRRILEIPRIGAVNLHPGFLPFNRGWHTPTWAILEGTPAGATLHFMDEGLDTGDIIAQRRLEVRPEDTADTLYRRILDLEVDLFREAWPLIASLDPPRVPQPPGAGSSHKASDLSQVQRIDLEADSNDQLLRRLRALTTSRIEEAAYFEAEGRCFRVRVEIVPD